VYNKNLPKTTELTIINKGNVPDVEDTSQLFNTFTRGKNAQHKQEAGWD
jgi:hypothetical protein